MQYLLHGVNCILQKPAAAVQTEAMMDEEKMGAAIDRLDSCVAMLVNMTTIADRTHVTSLRKLLPEIAAELRAALNT